MSSSAAKAKPTENHHHAKSKRDADGIPQEWDDLDITRDEFDSIRNAFKKEEFRQLFSDYYKEMTDPETRKQYQEEMRQLEAERGVEITFLNPTPHFVIKTSSNGTTKCFINIASNEAIDKPSNEIRSNPETNKKEMIWRLPYSQAEPRPDFDNKNNRCVVHDILFHPDAIRLAESNSKLRRHLVNTACDAVEREFKVELDRTNLKFPKMKYKGVAKAAVKRRLIKNSGEIVSESSPIDDHLPPMPAVKIGENKPNVYQSKDKKPEKYTTPKYIIKYRRGIDMSEMTYELDAKLNVTIPKALVIEIELPLLKTTSDCTLDVTNRKLYLISEKPAKYQLKLDLPYAVNDQLGSAKFDKDTKKLCVTLPVISDNHRSLKDLYREDSGVESDPREENGSADSPTGKESPISNNFESLQETVDLKKSLIEEINSDENSDEGFTKFEENNNDIEECFLRDDITYNQVPSFDCNILDNNLVFVLNVKNVDAQSIEYRKSQNHLHLIFTSIGAGYYPVFYSFYFKLPSEANEIHIEDVDAEAWDNNVILTLTLTNLDNLLEYSAGLNKNELKQYNTPGNLNTYNKLTLISKKDHNDDKLNQIDNYKFDIQLNKIGDSNKIEIEIKPKSPGIQDHESTEDEKSTEETEALNNQHNNNTQINANNNNNNQGKNKKKKNKKRRSYSESACDDLKANIDHENNSSLVLPLSPVKIKNKKDKNVSESTDEINAQNFETDVIDSERCISIIGGRKQRSFSETRSISDCTPTFKGILKHYSRYARSNSESCSSMDDQYSCSTDNLNPCESFSDIPEEGVEFTNDESPTENGHLSESVKKTVRFSEVIHKQLFRLDSSILGQRKKNQKKKNQKLRALQRRNSEGDTADYDDNRARSLLHEKKGNIKNNNNQKLSKSEPQIYKHHSESEIFELEM